MNLFDVAERLASIDRSEVKFTADRCLHTLDKASPCSACVEICPAQAITAGSPPIFNPEKCLNCLACLPVCPTGAYTANDSVQDLLLSALRLESDSLELICGLHPNPEQGLTNQANALVVSGCLASLGAGTGVALAITNFKHILYRCDACEQCPWGSLQKLIEKQVEEAKELLAAWGKKNVPQMCTKLENPVARPFWKVGNLPVSRRDLFSIAARQGMIVTAQMIENREETQSRQPGRDRIRKLKAAFALGEPTNSKSMLPKSGFVQLFANHECTACGICQRVCPTGALQLLKDEDTGYFKLVFYAGYCIDCGICLRACPINALERRGLPQFDTVFCTQKPVLLQDGKLTRCQRCNTLFAARNGEQFCPTCQFRRKNPFGSKLPSNMDNKVPDK